MAGKLLQLVLKGQSFPSDRTPLHLRKFSFERGGIPATCAKRTEHLSGMERVRAMNQCVAEEFRRRREDGSN